MRSLSLYLLLSWRGTTDDSQQQWERRSKQHQAFLATSTHKFLQLQEQQNFHTNKTLQSQGSRSIAAVAVGKTRCVPFDVIVLAHMMI